MKRSDKLVASVIVTTAAAVMTLTTVAAGWALSPPRLGIQSALLVPFGHLALRIGCPDWIGLGLVCIQFILLGIYVAHGWIRGALWRTLIIVGSVYGLGVIAAIFTGLSLR